MKGISLVSTGAGSALLFASITLSQGPGGGPPPSIPPGTTRFVFNLPAGAPQPRVSPDNVPTNEGVALGQRLFNDRRLSANNTLSCAGCHRGSAALSDAPKQFSVGIDNLAGSRNAMPLFNLSYADRFFWDGRAPSLRTQALLPIQDAKEMHQSLQQAVSKIAADPSYQQQFRLVFGSPGVNADRLGKAIEQFETTLLSFDSKFDRSQRGQATLTPQEQRGLQLFRTPFDPRRGQFGADCARCHGGSLFTDNRFRNNGLDAAPKDIGFQLVTGQPQDLGKFKTPSLRNLSITGPYMHDGRMASLDDVVRHYSSGIKPSATLDPILARQQGGVKLSPADQAALVAFLRTLTDPKYTATNNTLP